MGVWTFAMGITGQFGLIYLSRELHMSYSNLSILVRTQREQPDSEVERLVLEIQARLDEHPGNDFQAEGRTLRDKTMLIGEYILAGRMQESMDGLFELAVGMAALRYGVKFGSRISGHVLE